MSCLFGTSLRLRAGASLGVLVSALAFVLWGNASLAGPPRFSEVFFSLETVTAVHDVELEDATSQAAGASDLSTALFTGRTHREWEPTQLLARPMNIFPYTAGSGSSVTWKGRVEVVRDLAPDYVGGVQADIYGSGGDEARALFWGVTPPYQSNPFLARNADAFVNTLWVRQLSKEGVLRLGSFQPLHLPDHLFKGQPNPTLNGTPYLPLYGVDVSREFLVPFVVEKPVHEGFVARLAEGSPYRTEAIGAYYSPQYQDGKFGAGVLRLGNSRSTSGQVPAPRQGEVEGVPLTWEAPWEQVGPQEQTTYALDGSVVLDPQRAAKAWAAISHSVYRPQKGSGVRAKGNLFNVAVSSRVGLPDATLEYLSVDADYDPFLLPIQVPSGVSLPSVFYELPYFTTYRGQYSAHDTKKFPHNRQGIRAHLDYPLVGNRSFTRLYADYEFLRQKEASTASNLQRVGFVEPFFALRTSAGSATKGEIQRFGIGAEARLPANRNLSAGYERWAFQRAAPDENNLDFNVDGLFLSFSQPLKWELEKKITLDAGYTFFKAKGAYLSALDNLDLRQSGPFIGLTHKFTRPPDILKTVSLKYRLLDQNDKAPSLLLGDFNASRFSLEMRTDF